MILATRLKVFTAVLGILASMPVLAAEKAQESGVAPVKHSQKSPDEDKRLRQLVIGTWEDDYQGKRTMTLKDDGTGTMIVELEGVKAALFASRLTFNMKWSVEKGRLKKRTISGTPSGRVQMILKMMGDRVDEPILELSAKRLLLLDKDGETKYDWRRVR